MLPAVVASADPPGGPHAGPLLGIQQLGDQIEGVSNQVQDLSDQTQELSNQVQELQGDVDAIATTLDVQVSVDTTICDSTPIACAGGPYVPAYGWVSSSLTEGNQNPIALNILVTRNGVPVEGLALDDFLFRNLRVPAGGTSVALCAESENGRCVPNFSGEHGFYRMLLDPPGDHNYKAGGYAGTLEVTFSEDGRAYGGAALVTFEIPPDPSA